MPKNVLGFMQTHSGVTRRPVRRPALARKASPALDLTPDEQRRLAAEIEAAAAWKARGMPDDEVQYSDDAPRLSKEQLAEFEPASIHFRKS